jgi:hypothetical protein
LRGGITMFSVSAKDVNVPTIDNLGIIGINLPNTISAPPTPPVKSPGSAKTTEEKIRELKLLLGI